MDFSGLRRIASVALASVFLQGCAVSSDSIPVQTVTATATVTPSSSPTQVAPVPQETDYLATSLIEYKVEEGGWLIEGYLTIKFEVENTSGQWLRGLATTVRVKDSDGEVLFIKNLNKEIELEPGSSLEFGLFGEQRMGLFRAIPQSERLLDMESLRDETTVQLEVRKLMVEDQSIIEFVEDVPVPSEELENEID